MKIKDGFLLKLLKLAGLIKEETGENTLEYRRKPEMYG